MKSSKASRQSLNGCSRKSMSFRSNEPGSSRDDGIYYCQSSSDHKRTIVGCILGMAVGDALGLPYEGLTPQRAAKLLGRPDRQRLLLGCGMVSDDTEHACFVAQSLSPRTEDEFAQELATIESVGAAVSGGRRTRDAASVHQTESRIQPATQRRVLGRQWSGDASTASWSRD